MCIRDSIEANAAFQHAQESRGLGDVYKRQLLSSATALVRANVVQDLVARNLDGDAHFSLDALTALAGSPSDLVDAVNNAFLFGRLPAALKSNIVTAISATTDHNARVRNAIYLVCSSALYQVEH